MAKTDRCVRQAVILCGGLGSRLKPLTNDIPKPLAPANNRPYIAYILDQLAAYDFDEVVLLTGYLAKHIEEEIGTSWGRMKVAYSTGPTEWDTAKRVMAALPLLQPTFQLLYCDNYLNLDFQNLFSAHQEGKNPLTLVLKDKRPGNLEVKGSRVLNYDSSRKNPKAHMVELGYMLVARQLIEECYTTENTSFTAIIEHAVSRKSVDWVHHKSGYQSCSDLERLSLAGDFFRPKSIILIDRDGVINHKAPKGEYITSPKGFGLIQENIEQMADLADLGYKFVVITNQAGISRGHLTSGTLSEIHAAMKDQLAGFGIPILDIIICPHGWDEGCQCRKPRPGMLFEAAERHNLHLTDTFYIGDDPRDGEAAGLAGCRFIYSNRQDNASSIMITDRTGTIGPRVYENSLNFKKLILERQNEGFSHRQPRLHRLHPDSGAAPAKS